MNKTTAYWLIGSIVAAVLWYLFAYQPAAQQIDRHESRIAEAEAQLADFEQTILDLPQYLDTKNRLERFRQSLNSRLYAKGDILKLFRKLNLEAEQRSLDVIEITPPLLDLLELNAGNPGLPDPEFINITLDLEGGYVDFGRFVRFIEQADFCHGLNVCEIATADESAGRARLRLGFKALLGHEAGVS
jgi:Tfp pilus assembly protein PilO